MLGVVGAVPKLKETAPGLRPENGPSCEANVTALCVNGDVAADWDSCPGGDDDDAAVSSGVIAMLTGIFPELDFRFLARGAEGFVGDAGRDSARPMAAALDAPLVDIRGG
jgi:hypothetical protein